MTSIAHISHRSMRPLVLQVVAMVLMLLAVTGGRAESADKLFIIGTDAYKAKNYDQAITAYQTLLSDGYHTANVYYNLGNCYYKTEQISLAILNYERALRLAPSDDDIRFNLKLANLKIVDHIVPVPQLSIVTGWHSFVASRSSKTWAICSVVCAWLALIAMALYLFIVSIRRIAFYTGVGLLIFVIFFGYLGYAQRHAEYGAGQAILTVSNTNIKSAPDATSTDLYMIHEGVKLDILDKVGHWSKVRLADGKVGWVEQNNFTVI